MAMCEIRPNQARFGPGHYCGDEHEKSIRIRIVEY